MKTINLKSICTLLAIAAVLHGTYASINEGILYWHIFVIAGCFYSLAVADEKDEEK